jgi:hypothetical protein
MTARRKGMKGSERPQGGTITARLEESAARRLAVFCKRATIERVEPFAGDEGEAAKMLEALADLREALEAEGFAPR